jgi:hypothetical protein
MNPDEHNFEMLSRLLALKRHEQPPPGYFHSFSRQVIARIRAGERADTPVGFAPTAWLQRIWAVFEQKPVLAGSFGVAVCGFLVWAVAFSDTSPGPVDPGAAVPKLSVFAQIPDQSPGLQIPDRSDAERRFLAGFSSTNGGFAPPASRVSLFNELPPPHAQKAAWHIPGN